MVGNENNLHPCYLSQFEFFDFDASKNDFFPRLNIVSFFSIFNGLLILPEMDQTTGNLRITLQFCEKNFGSFEHSLVVKFVSSSCQIRIIWLLDKVFNFLQSVQFRQTVNVMIVNLHFFLFNSGHLQKLQHFRVLLHPHVQFDKFFVITWILSLDESIDSIDKLFSFQESESQFSPNFALVNFLGKFRCSFNGI